MGYGTQQGPNFLPRPFSSSKDSIVPLTPETFQLLSSFYMEETVVVFFCEISLSHTHTHTHFILISLDYDLFVLLSYM